MCFLEPRVLRITTEQNRIPDAVLVDILCVYEFAKREDIPALPNELICKRNGDFWTTWTKVLDIRDNNKSIPRKEDIMNSDQIETRWQRSYEGIVADRRDFNLKVREVLELARSIYGYGEYDRAVQEIKNRRLTIIGREKRKHFPLKKYQMLFGRQKGNCGICRLELEVAGPPNVIDHKDVNRTKGYNSDSNLQLVHKDCNAEKAAKSIPQQAKHYGETMMELI